MYRRVGTLGVIVALALVFASSAAAASFEARGSTEQVDVTGLTPNAPVSLVNSSDTVVQSRNANSRGGALFRDVAPGSGYKVQSGAETSDPLTVSADPIKADTAAAPPDPGTLYSQTLQTHGYGYMTMRDGTQLAYDVHPPTDVASALPAGPLQTALSAVIAASPALATPNSAPTLVEYSGYGYANPAGPVSGIEALANLMGFTVVDVNMRGTGCSGGAFDFFEPLQNLDGYDVVETVSHQPWVAHGKVGMLGISYGGISQLFTGQTQPPDLAAIAPLSVIDQTQTTLYPGGVLNTGFAVNWAPHRNDQAKPADPSDPDNGAQPYAVQRIADGDTICEDNQDLHPEAADLMAKIRANDHYIPEVADPLSPITFVNRSNGRAFLPCQWTDDKTAGHCPTLAEHMTGTNKKWFTFTNGTHVDSLDPETYNKWYDFLELYVAKQAPSANAARIQATAPLVYQAAMGIDNVSLPPDPIQQEPTYD